MIIKQFAWDADKNQALKNQRGISFEDVVVCIGNDGLLDVIAHPNQGRYSGQKIFIVAFDDYAYLVPFVEDERLIFLKTIIPSRKATKQFLNR